MGQSDKASRRAEERERQNEAQIAQNMGAIDRVFAGREPQYQQFGDALRAQYREEIDRAAGKNDLQLKFAMARSGNTGGSLDIDTRRDAGEQYQRTLIEGERAAQSGMADLRGADEASRAQLQQMVQAGGEIGSASARASASMQNNLAAAQSRSEVGQFGQAFDRFGDIIDTSRKQAEYRRGRDDYSFGYTPSFGFGGK